MAQSSDLLTDLFSTTDPDATPMRLKGGGIHLGYHTHYVVDGGKRRIMLAVLVVPGEVMDNQPMLDLLWYVSFRWRVRPRHVTGDTNYGTMGNTRPPIMDQLGSPMTRSMISIAALSGTSCFRLTEKSGHNSWKTVRLLARVMPAH
jgi:hypothetical protein